MLSNLLTIPIVREKIKVKLALAIPKVAPTTLVNEMIDTPPNLGYIIKSSNYLLNVLLHDSL